MTEAELSFKIKDLIFSIDHARVRKFVYFATEDGTVYVYFDDPNIEDEETANVVVQNIKDMMKEEKDFLLYFKDMMAAGGGKFLIFNIGRK